MFSNALRLSTRVIKTSSIFPVRTIVTCANHNAFTPRKTNITSILYEQKRTFIGPLIRMATQALTALSGSFIRAFFQAFQQAASQAETADTAAPTQSREFSLKKLIPIPEALMIMNLERIDVNASTLSDRFDKYFAANDPKHGGSFYLQSKVYRSHEALLEELTKYGYVRDESAKMTVPSPSAEVKTVAKE